MTNSTEPFKKGHVQGLFLGKHFVIKSYATVIAARIDNEWFVCEEGFSNTTRKHKAMLFSGEIYVTVPHDKLMLLCASA